MSDMDTIDSLKAQVGVLCDTLARYPRCPTREATCSGDCRSCWRGWSAREAIINPIRDRPNYVEFSVTIGTTGNAI